MKMARSTIGSLGIPEVERSMREEKLAQTVVMASDEYKEARERRLHS